MPQKKFQKLLSVDDGEKQAPVGFMLLIVLNLVPLIGVLSWGWQSFDLIFLYWMENLVIGAFTAARMVIRPYSHPLDYAFPFFLAPFFCFHYGMFCWGHGTFVVSLFGPEGANGFDLVPATLEVLRSPYMLAALGALTLIQAGDWVRDIRARGFGADNVKDLMVKPYRRIVVLHITIIAAGFALAALDEPTAGLLVLVLVKTASDAWHWKKDSEAEAGEALDPSALLTPARMAEMAEKYPEPKVTVNGQERKFSSFAEMKASREFRMAQSMMRMLGAGKELKLLAAYLDMKVAEEEGRQLNQNSALSA